MKLKLGDIRLDEDVYPRIACNWQTQYKYAQEMNAGAQFPPLIVARIQGKHGWILIDGRHRYEAYKFNKVKQVEVQDLGKLTMKDAYLEAVKRNMTHGFQYTVSDKVKMALKLEKEFKFSPAKIAGIINVPVSKIKGFVAKRVTNDINGKPVILKKQAQFLANQREPITPQQEVGNHEIRSSHLGSEIDNLIDMLNTGVINIKNKQIRSKLVKLSNMLTDMGIHG